MCPLWIPLFQLPVLLSTGADFGFWRLVGAVGWDVNLHLQLMPSGGKLPPDKGEHHRDRNAKAVSDVADEEICAFLSGSKGQKDLQRLSALAAVRVRLF